MKRLLSLVLALILCSSMLAGCAGPAVGGEMKSKADWKARRKEISDMYQYYMYGVWRDGTDEIVTYDYNYGTLTVYIERTYAAADIGKVFNYTIREIEAVILD